MKCTLSSLEHLMKMAFSDLHNSRIQQDLFIRPYSVLQKAHANLHLPVCFFWFPFWMKRTCLHVTKYYNVLLLSFSWPLLIGNIRKVGLRLWRVSNIGFHSVNKRSYWKFSYFPPYPSPLPHSQPHGKRCNSCTNEGGKELWIIF